MIIEKKLVSIIIPTYNRKETILRTINSCINQNYKNIEIIIVDDGSNDNTKEMIYLNFKKEILKKKIYYYKFIKNKGVIKARNFGINKSKGEWIILLDSDDELLKDSITTFLKISSNNKKYSIFFAHFINDLNHKSKLKNINKNILTYKDFICKNGFIGDALPFVNKEVFNKISYNANSKRNMSTVWYKIFKEYDIFIVNKFLGLCHMQGNDRITKNKIKDAKLWIDGIKEFLNLFQGDIEKNCHNCLSVHLRNLGIFYYLLGDKKNARKYFIKSIKYNKIDYKNYIIYILSFNKYLFNKINT